MRAIRRSALWIGLGLALAGPAWAEIGPGDLAPTGPRDPAVERALAWERLQTEVIYLRPSAEFEPDQAIRIAVPDPAPTEAEARRASRWTWGLVFGAILIGLAVLLVVVGGRIQVGFAARERRRPGAPAATGAGRAERAAVPLDGFLERLAAMADRRAALILLVGQALERAAAANDMRLGRAQTARDILRALPGAWAHLPVLSDLVREAELVHFGGRDLAEERFRACLAAAGPIFAAARAR